MPWTLHAESKSQWLDQSTTCRSYHPHGVIDYAITMQQSYDPFDAWPDHPCWWIPSLAICRSHHPHHGMWIIQSCLMVCGLHYTWCATIHMLDCMIHGSYNVMLYYSWHIIDRIAHHGSRYYIMDQRDPWSYPLWYIIHDALIMLHRLRNHDAPIASFTICVDFCTIIVHESMVPHTDRARFAAHRYGIMSWIGAIMVHWSYNVTTILPWWRLDSIAHDT